MGYLRHVLYSITVGVMILLISVWNLWTIDFYAVILVSLYIILESVSRVGSDYFDLTQQSKSSKATFKFFFNPPTVFFLVLAFCYATFARLHWIFVGVSAFLALIVCAYSYSDWVETRKKEQNP